MTHERGPSPGCSPPAVTRQDLIVSGMGYTYKHVQVFKLDDIRIRNGPKQSFMKKHLMLLQYFSIGKNEIVSKLDPLIWQIVLARKENPWKGFGQVRYHLNCFSLLEKLMLKF